MSEKLLERKIFQGQNLGFGVTVPVNCFQTPFGVESFLVEAGFSINVAAGSTLTLKAWAPVLFMNRIRLSGSRQAATDMFVNTSALQLVWNNVYDYGLQNVNVNGPIANSQTYPGPGTYFFGCVLRIDMAPVGMSLDMKRRTWFPGNAYSTLTMEIDFRSLAGLVVGALPAGVTEGGSGLLIHQRQQPQAWNISRPGEDLFYYQRLLQNQIPINSSGEFTSNAPQGNLIERIDVIDYDRSFATGLDNLFSQVIVREQTSNMFDMGWQNGQDENAFDRGLGNPFLQLGRLTIPFGRWGLPENLLDCRKWGSQGRTLTTALTVPSIPVTPVGVDVHYNQFIGPYRLPIAA